MYIKQCSLGEGKGAFVKCTYITKDNPSCFGCKHRLISQRPKPPVGCQYSIFRLSKVNKE